MTTYITDQQFRDYIKDPSTDNADLVLTSIGAASRAIEAYCGRFFDQRAETQYFSASAGDPKGLWLLWLDDMDLATTDGLTVTTETGNDGTYPTTWTVNVDFLAEPVNQSQNGITGWPYTRLRAIGGKVWPIRFIDWYRDTIKITGTWGWPAVPDPVVQATKIMAAQYYKLSDAPLGVAGWGAYGDIRVRDIPQVQRLLSPYRKAGSLGVA